MMSTQISDATGAIWVQAFNETGQQIFEKTAEEMYNLRMNVNVFSVKIIIFN